MKSADTRKRLQAAAAIAVALAVILPSSPGRAGDDAGIAAFFRSQFGIGLPAAQPEPSYTMPEDRPIVVRPRHRRVVTRRPEAKIAVGPVAPVSIYEDKTLRPGDAIMTAKGIRVFLGGHGAPYTEADFASLTDAEGLPKQVEKALLVIDKAPRT